ncbi:MAG: DUF2934 domain-containing protein [Pseudomonadota bacterium]
MFNKATNRQGNVTSMYRVTLTPEERYRMICEAAYFIAERRGFSGGDPVQDWLAAEEKVDRMLGRR